jgi:hypothetical protein
VADEEDVVVVMVRVVLLAFCVATLVVVFVTVVEVWDA